MPPRESGKMVGLGVPKPLHAAVAGAVALICLSPSYAFQTATRTWVGAVRCMVAARVQLLAQGLALLFLLVVVTALCAQPSPPQRDPPGSPAASVDSVQQAALLVASSRFKLLAADSYPRALFEFATPAAVARFRDLDATTWTATDPGFGWSFFLGTSVQAVATPVSGTNLVAYYNPWSDVLLLTE